jgi:predicted HNH restriction endonuclease
MILFYQNMGELAPVNIQKTVVDNYGKSDEQFKQFQLKDIESYLEGLNPELIARVKKDLLGNRFQFWGLPSGAAKVLNPQGNEKAKEGDYFLFLVPKPSSRELDAPYLGKMLTEPFECKPLSSQYWDWDQYGKTREKGTSHFSQVLILECISIKKRWADISPRLGKVLQDNSLPKSKVTYRIEDKLRYWNDTDFQPVDGALNRFIEFLKEKELKDSQSSASPEVHVALEKETLDCTPASAPTVTSAVSEQRPMIRELPEESTNNTKLYLEGFEKEIVTNRHERDPSVALYAKKIHGETCKVCGFIFGDVYGDHGRGFIEAHHLYPVSEGERHTNPETDMTVLCSNCHRMIHRGGEMLTVEELRCIVEKARESKSE